MRLNKRLVEIGYCSRRNADKLIDAGKVFVNGKLATLGMQVKDDDDIEIDGEKLKNDNEKIIIAYNKPKGVVCTESNAEKTEKISDKIKEFGLGKRLFTIGRLDKDSTGLILITNDGDFAKEITDKKNNYEKEYIVRVNKPITNDFIKKMENGLVIEIPDNKKKFTNELRKEVKDGKKVFEDENRPMIKVKTKKAKIHLFGSEEYRFSIIITEGINRQIRRMCRALGYHVVDLKRIRIMKLKLGDLKTGEYKKIKKEEIL